MPRYRPETEKARAINFTKALIKSGLSQTALAKREGITPQAISQRLKRAPIKKTFIEMMDKAGLTDIYLHKKMKEGLESKRDNKKPDMHCRHKYLVTALEAKNIIKHTNGNGKGGVSALIININDRSGLFSETETKTISPIRS